MSTLVENVAKVTAAHAALKEAIAAKGVNVPDGAKLTDMPALVGQISTELVPTNARACFAGDVAVRSLVVPRMMVVDMTAIDNLKLFFYYNNMTSLTLPEGFGESATTLQDCFNSCMHLESLTLPAGFGQNATNLENAFRSCYHLQHLELPAGFGQNATNLTYCFYDIPNLTSLMLPAGFGQNATNLTSAFRSCSKLQHLELPAGFGQNATNLYHCFRDNRNLTSLMLPAGFGQNATNLTSCFLGCSALKTITGNPNFKVSLDLSPCTNLTHDSIMVVINGLQTVTTTQNLTLGTENLAKLTDDEKKVATDKGWTLA